MKTILPHKNTLPGVTILLFLSFATLFSCKKDIDNNDSPGNQELPDLSSKINSSVSGFVTDENNAPVSGASVQFGTASIITNQFGFFEFKNIEVIKVAAFITVTKAGYFKGIKTWAVTEGQDAFFRIKLLSKTIAGIISSSSAGSIALSNDMSISLPANAVVVAASNGSYAGTINVAAQWINPESDEMSLTMPGDLRAIDKNGHLKVLTTYGMAAIELTGDNGELLQIAGGKKATITMPVPAPHASSALSSIPLWYFDENTGLWKEEGTAVKIGNKYVGEVSHFSYWNFDLPNPSVALSFNLVNQQSLPISNTFVKIKSIGSIPGAIYGYTNSTGNVSVFVAANTTYRLEVYPFNFCLGSPSYTQDFPVTTTAVSLGTISIQDNLGAATISGTVTDCNNQPVTNGHVFTNIGPGNYFSTVLNSNGDFNLSLLLCGSPSDVVISASDLSASAESVPQLFTVSSGANAIGNIQVCGGQLLNYISNGYLYHPSSPRGITNYPKTLGAVSATAVKCYLGDLGPSGYVAMFDVNPVTHKITITAIPGSAGAPYYQWDSSLPSADPPGPVYTAAWPGSPQCNNTYDPATHIYYLRYGYIGATGYRVSEEILTPQ